MSDLVTTVTFDLKESGTVEFKNEAGALHVHHNTLDEYDDYFRIPDEHVRELAIWMYQKFVLSK